MLDDFREQANASFEDEEEAPEFAPETRVRRQFLGMSPAQRLVIVTLLLVLTCLMGSLCLLVTDKVALPF